jgi:hypothetical protein
MERTLTAVALHDVQRFYFHLHNDVEARDPDGTDLPNLAAARIHALSDARFTVAETIKETGRLNLSHHIDIEDENGTVLDTIYFRDAVTIEGP